MRIYIPDMELVETLEFAKEIFNKTTDDEKVVLDFSRMSNFDPLPMLIMGATLRKYRHQFPEKEFRIDGYSEKSYACTMGFFKYISESLGIGKLPGEAHGSNNYIPITPINIDELKKEELAKGNLILVGDLIEKEAERLARVIDRGNKELHKLLTYLIREILRNTPEHAKINTMWICGQYWPSYELAEIAIADEGIGIYDSITQNHSHREYINDNKEALQWALKAGISEAFKPSTKQTDCDAWANSGFGLYMVNSICNYLNGSFCIISCGDYMLIDNHGIKYGATDFQGTAIRMRIPSKKISDAQTIISQIAKQGEMEAKTIRNAFKNASIPSKGLMSELNIY